MLKRIGIYLNEMFPFTSFLGTMLTAFAFQLIYLRLNGVGVNFHYQMILSGIVITGVTLLIRVMDEFKDYEDDLRNYPNRPLPSGRINRKDLKILGGLCILSVLVFSLCHLNTFLFSLVLLGFTFLMLKWFFIENKMRQSLPLALISHHPIVLLNIMYLIISMMETFPESHWRNGLLVLPISLIFTNWEFSRKIRMPESETEYTTYSKIWGPKKAAAVCLLVQSTYTATVFAIFSKLSTPLYFRIIFALLMLVLMSPMIKFFFTLKLKGPLKTNAENQIIMVLITLIVASFL